MMADMEEMSKPKLLSCQTSTDSVMGDDKNEQHATNGGYHGEKVRVVNLRHVNHDGRWCLD